MKRLATFCLVLFIIAVVTGCTGLFLTSRAIGNSGSWQEITKDHEGVNIEGVDRIRVNTNCARVVVEPVDGSDITVFYTGRASSSFLEDFIFDVDLQGGLLTIRAQYQPLGLRFLQWGEILQSAELRVGIPTAYESDLSVDSDAGMIELGVARLGNVRLDSSAGNIKLLSPLEANTLSLEVSAGAITTKDLTVKEEFDVVSRAGSVTIGAVRAYKGSVSVSAGSVTMENIIGGQWQIQSSAGRIRATFGKIDDDVQIKASAGGIEVDLPQNAFDLEAKASAGSVRCEFSSVERISSGHYRGKVGGGGPQVRLSSSAGSITIREGTSSGSF